jgi:hypothetical protein
MNTPADFSVFAHLNAEKAGLYRAILTHFVTERARFVISLRPAEIHATLTAALSSENPDTPPHLNGDLEAIAT